MKRIAEITLIILLLLQKPSSILIYSWIPSSISFKYDSSGVSAKCRRSPTWFYSSKRVGQKVGEPWVVLPSTDPALIMRCGIEGNSQDSWNVESLQRQHFQRFVEFPDWVTVVHSVSTNHIQKGHIVLFPALIWVTVILRALSNRYFLRNYSFEPFHHELF
jgi:hypothetical protein